MSDLLPGIEIDIGEQKWTVPPLTLGRLRRLKPEIDKIATSAGIVDGEVIDAVIRIVTAAMQRNYPNLAEELVGEMLDLANAGSVLSAVLTGSGLRRSDRPGEASAAAGDGTTSTASSPPPSVTGPETSTN